MHTDIKWKLIHHVESDFVATRILHMKESPSLQMRLNAKFSNVRKSLECTRPFFDLLPYYAL